MRVSRFRLVGLLRSPSRLPSPFDPCAGAAFAATVDVYTFDESGHGSVTLASDGRVLPLVSRIDFDPDPFLINVKTLLYELPTVPHITDGFVGLDDGNGSCDTLLECSDVLHFSSIVGGVYFYSDQELGEPSDLADNGDALFQAVHQALHEGLLVISEVGSEGANGTVYTPRLDDPGGSFAGLDVSYRIISDGPLAVPEPSSLILLVAGAGLGAIKWRRHRRK